MLVDAIVVARGDARRASLPESLGSLSDRGWDLPIRVDKFQIRFSGRSALGDLSLAVISSTRDLSSRLEITRARSDVSPAVSVSSTPTAIFSQKRPVTWYVDIMLMPIYVI